MPLHTGIVGREKVNCRAAAREAGLGHDLGAPHMPNHNGIFAAMRRRHTRGETRSFSPLANHPFSFGREQALKRLPEDLRHLLPQIRTRCARKSKWHLPIAARPPQRVSKSGVPPRRARRPRRAKMAWATTSAYHLVGARIARPHTCTRPERRLHGNGKRKPHIASTSAPGVRRKTEPPRRYRKSNFSTVCGQICLRSRAPANIPRRGVIRKRGQSAPSCAPVARSDTFCQL